VDCPDETGTESGGSDGDVEESTCFRVSTKATVEESIEVCRERSRSGVRFADDTRQLALRVKPIAHSFHRNQFCANSLFHLFETGLGLMSEEQEVDAGV
jgi:hypothetical protein